MPLDIEINAAEEKVTIKLPVKFDINVVDNLHDAVRKLPKYVLNYELDMENTEYMDASALGSLMILKHEKPEAKTMDVINCNKEIRYLLMLMHYDEMFNIKSNSILSQKIDDGIRVA